MSTINFIDQTTVVPASWLNDANAVIYGAVAVPVAALANAVPYTGITSLPTTLSGYGITDAAHSGTNSDITSLTGLTAVSPLVGVIDGSSAAAGKLGEYVVANPSGQAVTTNTPLNVGSISLTAGDWDVTGVINFNCATTTSVTLLQACSNNTSATMTSVGVSQVYSAFVPGNGNSLNFALPTVRYSLTTTTTIYLVANATFTISTMTSGGQLRARRVR